jgi:N-acetylglucosaminyldiphosphoundecaprenol N-acetyl-beta-D-mannosaminyltransferase
MMLPDGHSIVVASRLLGDPLKQRVAGPDLIYEFMKKSNDKKYSNFFLGAKDGVAKKMVDRFLKKFPDIKIAGIYSPPFGDFTKKENDKMINMINKAKPDVLWVSFGCPKQEKWILDNLDRIKVPVSAGVGAAFDFHSGEIKRAPVFVQKVKLEWFYRLLQEPKRLWRRYLIGGFNFLFIIINQKLKKH